MIDIIYSNFFHDTSEENHTNTPLKIDVKSLFFNTLKITWPTALIALTNRATNKQMNLQFVTPMLQGVQMIILGMKLRNVCGKELVHIPDNSQSLKKMVCSIGALTGSLLLIFGSLRIKQSIELFMNPVFPHIWKVAGSQNDMSGLCDRTKVLSIYEKLQKTPSQEIFFAKEHLNTKELEGGTCSAMALHTANELFKNLCIEQESVSCIQEVLGKYRTSGQEFRDIQAAFNAIAVTPAATATLSGPSLVQRKMSALGSFFGLQAQNPCDLHGLLEESSSAIFLGRAISPANNHKQEAFGHSILVIRHQGESIVYDPNTGGISFPLENVSNALRSEFSRISHMFGLLDFSFFKLTPIVID